jgi:predicted nucleotidyltransferase
MSGKKSHSIKESHKKYSIDQNTILSRIKNTVLRDYPKAKIILFGSRSRGTAGHGSDWDVLIIINEVISEKEKIALHNKIFEIELSCGEIINAIIHTRQEWNDPLMKSTPFFQNVVKEGITV